MKIALSPTIKYIVTPAIGFGLAGLIWGWEAYRGTVGAGETFTNPFSYILGAVAFGILGSLSLVLFSGDKKKIFKAVTMGLVGWIVSFLVPALFLNWLLIGGGILLLPVAWIAKLIKIDLVSLLRLDPSLIVGHLWLEFLFTGLLVGLMYGLLLKVKIRQIIVYCAIGFASISWGGPIFGSLIGNAIDSLFVGYLVTFGLIGTVLGLLLGGVMIYQKK